MPNYCVWLRPSLRAVNWRFLSLAVNQGVSVPCYAPGSRLLYTTLLCRYVEPCASAGDVLFLRMQYTMPQMFAMQAQGPSLTWALSKAI